MDKSGVFTVTASLGTGSTSYLYLTATSLVDSTQTTEAKFEMTG